MPLDRLAAAGDPHLRQILLYGRAQLQPFTAAEAAAAIGVHRTVARARLDRLVEAGFLTVTLERRAGRRGPGAGRPAKVYRVAPELAGLEFPDRRYRDLIALLLEKIPARGRERALRRAGEDFGRHLATTARLAPAVDLRAGLERVCAALGTLGFQVSLGAVEREHATLATPTCPLRPLVLEHAASSAIDRGMWAGLIAQSLDGVHADAIACEMPCCRAPESPCEIRISLRAHKPERPGGKTTR